MAVLPPDPLFCLKGAMGHIHSICFDDIRNELLAATEDGMVYFWDLEKNRLRSKQNMGKSIQAVHSVKDYLITQEKEGMVKLWIHTEVDYKVVKTYNCASGFCKTVVFEDNLIVPQIESTIDVVDIHSMSLKTHFVPQQSKLGMIMCVQQVVINKLVYILAGFESGDILLWDFVSNKVCSHIKLREYITSITFDTQTLRGVCGNASNILQIFSMDKEFHITLKCEVLLTNEGCNIVKLRGDRKIFVSGGWDGRLRLYSWKSLRLLAVLHEHKGSITDVQFSNNVIQLWGNKIMAAASSDGNISLWSLYN